MNNKYYLMARVEGYDRKSFFAVAESDNGIDGFRFWDYPVVLPDTEPEETNVYDMRLSPTWGRMDLWDFCSESRDPNAPLHDQSSAIASSRTSTDERLNSLGTLTQY